MRTLLILVALIALLAPARAAADTTPPADLSIAWTGPARAALTWTQRSDATMVCLDKRTSANEFVFLGCEDSAPGWHAVALGSGGDGAYAPRVGDRYRVSEWRDGTMYGAYVTSALPPASAWLWLPLLAR